ncbi:DUF4214 domain-containing protein [Oxalobacteraceae bacterium OM1]|nr:DUF4214 domain-containing protein [Oxalobacteraceae bacterium OM1]
MKQPHFASAALAAVVTFAACMLSACGGSPADTSANASTSGTTLLASVAANQVTSFSGRYADYTVANSGSGFTITDKSGTVQALPSGIKRLQFSDYTLALDFDGTAGQAYRLYQAAFNRKPDTAGLGYQILAMERHGTPHLQIAQNFIDSAEFASLYGNLDNGGFVTRLYNNVLHRDPDAGGYAVQVNALNTWASRPQLLVNFSESTENQQQVAGDIRNGILYIPLPRAKACMSLGTDAATGLLTGTNHCAFAIDVNYCTLNPDRDGSAAMVCAGQEYRDSPTGYVFGKERVTIQANSTTVLPGTTRSNGGSDFIWTSVCMAKQVSPADGATPFITDMTLPLGPTSQSRSVCIY